MAINCEQGFNLGSYAMEARHQPGVCILYREHEKSIDHLLIKCLNIQNRLVRSGEIQKSKE